jgi:hypothetical protein
MQQQKAGQAVHLSMAIEIPHLAHPFLWTFDWSGSETGPSAYDGFPPVCIIRCRYQVSDFLH